jgi:hypothetical protein
VVMTRKFCVASVLALSLAACQSTDPNDYRADQDCLQKKAGSKILSKVVGIGLGAVVPGGGLAGRAVGLATDPRCQAFRLTPQAEERIRRQPPARSQRPLDTLPSSTPTQP